MEYLVYYAGVNYCAQGSNAIIQQTAMPIQFCMARFDNNPQVGEQGNAAALANSEAMNVRAVCSKFFIRLH